MNTPGNTDPANDIAARRQQRGARGRGVPEALTDESWAQRTILAAVDEIQSMEPRMAAIEITTPLADSLYEADRRAGEEYGTLPLLTAAGKLAVALDHLQAFATMAEGEGLRRFASMSLLRPAFEAGPAARWLSDPAVTAHERLGRAFGAAVDNLEWSHRAEEDMVAAGWSPGPEYRRGQDRRTSLEEWATTCGVRIVRSSAVSLLRLYPATRDPNMDVVAFRFVSGLLHGHEWAVMIGDFDGTPGTDPVRVGTTINPDIAAGWVQAAVEHFRLGLAALERYAAPH